ncbi:MAG: CinA family nicotinamide mononucleotide deamidase-related protein [Candidatus Cloacimonetes bacterium]|nr:CinA family nicotinamide mononucleotide deamidase-related protein [Candidatus Cloacimonadota bacterium]
MKNPIVELFLLKRIKMNAAIINIGNEILMGKTINTNLAYLGSELTKLGILAEYAVTIKDEPNAIKQILQDTWKKYDIVITTGGLGPTEDDLTKAAIANFFGKNQHFDNSIWEHIQKMFAFRNIPIPETNRSQAMVPDDFIPLQNDLGTAPGLLYQEGDYLFFALQGVPSEMKHIFETHIKKIIAKTYPNYKPLHIKTLRTYEIAESRLAELFTLSDLPEGISIAWLPQIGRVDLRFYGTDVRKVEEAADSALNKIHPYVWGYDEESPAEILLSLLLNNFYTLSVAESCTGGLVQKLVTDVPGASNSFLGGVITYTNELKKKILKVSDKVLETKGAVSETCAMQMAEGIKLLTNSTCAISITGIAGPDGGTEKKPVGTVCFGFIAAEKHWSEKQFFTGDREIVRIKAAEFAILTLIKYLQGRYN